MSFLPGEEAALVARLEELLARIRDDAVAIQDVIHGNKLDEIAYVVPRAASGLASAARIGLREIDRWRIFGGGR